MEEYEASPDKVKEVRMVNNQKVVIWNEAVYAPSTSVECGCDWSELKFALAYISRETKKSGYRNNTFHVIPGIGGPPYSVYLD